MNDLFADVESDKRRDEIEPIGNQPCTQLLYFTMDERDRFKHLVKIAIKEQLGEDANKGNISDFVLSHLEKHYGSTDI